MERVQIVGHVVLAEKCLMKTGNEYLEGKMGIRNQQRVHKKLQNYHERLNVIESILVGTLYVVYALCGVGFVMTACIDVIRTTPIEYDWLQITGLCVLASLGLTAGIVLRLLEDRDG